MEDTSVSIKARSSTVTSHTKASRQGLNVRQNTSVGVKPHTVEKEIAIFRAEGEKIRDMLARLKDVAHNWPCKMPDKLTGELNKMPAPLISNEYDFIVFAFPRGGHVIENAVTSEGTQNFMVDGKLVIPEDK